MKHFILLFKEKILFLSLPWMNYFPDHIVWATFKVSFTKISDPKFYKKTLCMSQLSNFILYQFQKNTRQLCFEGMTCVCGYNPTSPCLLCTKIRLGFAIELKKLEYKYLHITKNQRVWRRTKRQKFILLSVTAIKVENH